MKPRASKRAGVNQTFGPYILSNAVPGTADQSALIQSELDAMPAGGVLLVTPGQYTFTATTDRAHTGAAVPGGTAGQVNASIHVPRNVGLASASPDPRSLRMTFHTAGWPAYAFGVHLDDGGGSGLLTGFPNLASCNVETYTATPANAYGTWQALVPPSLPRAIYCDNGGMEHVAITGAWKSGQYIVGDHFTTRSCILGGWAGLEQGSPQITGGDNAWYSSFVTGNSISVYITETQFGGYFQRCHFGLKNAGFLVDSSTANTVLLAGILFEQCGFEGSGRGFFLNPSKMTAMQDITFLHCATSGNFDGQLVCPDVPYATYPAGPFMQAASVKRIRVEGAQQFFAAIGYDPAYGTLIDAGNIRDCDLGILGSVTGYANSYGVPMIRCSGALSNVRGTMTMERNDEQTCDVRFVHAKSAVSRGDVMRRVQTASDEQAQRYDGLNKQVLGVAAQSGAINTTVPVITRGPAHTWVSRTGRSTGAGVTSMLPPATRGATGTLFADLVLGTDRVVRSVEDANPAGLAPTVLRLTSLGDFISTGGRFSVNGTVYTYTGATQDIVTGLWQFNGITPNLPASNPAGGTPIGKVIDLGAPATAFTSTGGVAKVGSVYVCYQSRSGNFLLNVSGGSGTIIAGAAVTDVTIFQLSESTGADFPTTYGSAIIGASPYPQFNYEAVVQNKLTVYSSGQTSYLADITGAIGGAFTAGSTTYVTGGTRLNGAVTLPAATITVRSTTGIPVGPLRIGGQPVTCTGKTATTFTGCSGGTGVIPDGSPVTVSSCLQIAGDVLLRPRYGPVGYTDPADAGLVAVASSFADANGKIIGHAARADTGPTICVDVDTYG